MSRYTFEMPAEAPAAPAAGVPEGVEARYTFEMPEARSRAGNVAHQLGLTARAGVNAAANTVGIVTNPIAASINLGGQALGFDPQIPFAREAADSLMTSAGVPVPETRQERIVGQATEGAAGAAGMVGAGRAVAELASPVAKYVGGLMSAGPGLQAVSGAAGAGNAARVAEDGGSTWDQIKAGLVGAGAPVALQAAGSATVRGLARGGEAGRAAMADRITTVEGAGAEPTVGLATGNRRMQATEAGLMKAPGSAGPMSEKAAEVGTDLGKRVSSLADGVAANSDADLAGRAIEQGVKGFTQRFRGKQEFLYNQVDRHLPAQTAVDVSNTRAALVKLTEDIQGAPELSAKLKNANITGIAEAFVADAGANGTLPYEAIKAIRSKVGAAMIDGPLVSGAPTAQLKQLYAGLSKDMEAAAAAAGPDAERAMARANSFTRAGMTRIEDHLQRSIGKTAEETYKTLVSDPGNASKIAVTLKSLEPAERDIVKATVIERMGKATAGKQNEAGDVFSPETFLTNWNKMAPKARAVLFEGQGGQLMRDLDQVAKTAAMMREQSKVFANPAGTAAAGWNMAAQGGMGALVVTGQFGAAGLLMGGLAGLNGGAKLMTSPTFVHWLARTTKMPTAALPASLQTLTQVQATETDEEVKDAIGGFIRTVSEKAGQTSPPR